MTRVRARPRHRAARERARTGRVAVLDAPRVGASFIACTRRLGLGPIAILLWGDYSRFAMRRATSGAASARARRSRSSSATPIPATTSSRKWFASPARRTRPRRARAPRTAFAHQCRQTRDEERRRRCSASAAWRLGIAAYGLRERGEDAVRVVDAVDEADAREHPRRRRRQKT